jgi:hypothetical protein
VEHGDAVQNNSGDPFSSKSVIDRAKLLYFGVRDYFLSVVEQEKKEFEAAQRSVVERDTIPNAGDDCPSCRAEKSIREAAAGVMRCSACGWQPRVINPPGVSRSQLESWQGYSPEHRAKFKSGFGNAVARITGRRK